MFQVPDKEFEQHCHREFERSLNEGMFPEHGPQWWYGAERTVPYCTVLLILLCCAVMCCAVMCCVF